MERRGIFDTNRPSYNPMDPSHNLRKTPCTREDAEFFERSFDPEDLLEARTLGDVDELYARGETEYWLN